MSRQFGQKRSFDAYGEGFSTPSQPPAHAHAQWQFAPLQPQMPAYIDLTGDEQQHRPQYYHSTAAQQPSFIPLPGYLRGMQPAHEVPMYQQQFEYGMPHRGGLHVTQPQFQSQHLGMARPGDFQGPQHPQPDMLPPQYPQYGMPQQQIRSANGYVLHQDSRVSQLLARQTQPPVNPPAPAMVPAGDLRAPQTKGGKRRRTSTPAVISSEDPYQPQRTESQIRKGKCLAVSAKVGPEGLRNTQRPDPVNRARVTSKSPRETPWPFAARTESPASTMVEAESLQESQLTKSPARVTEQPEAPHLAEASSIFAAGFGPEDFASIFGSLAIAMPKPATPQSCPQRGPSTPTMMTELAEPQSAVTPTLQLEPPAPSDFDPLHPDHILNMNNVLFNNPFLDNGPEAKSRRQEIFEVAMQNGGSLADLNVWHEW